MTKIIAYRRWLWPLLLLLCIAPWTPWLDLSIANWFYQPQHSWPNNRLIEWLYAYGRWPGMLVGYGAALGFLCSLFFKTFKKWRLPCLYLALTLGIGSGLIVHAGLKDHWGRPRPRQLVQFGGTERYHPFWQPDFSQQGRQFHSFPSGHVSIGFFLCALYLTGLRLRKKWLSHLGLWSGLGLGVALSYARLAAGGHFMTDALFAGAIMWWIALLIDWMLYSSNSS